MESLQKQLTEQKLQSVQNFPEINQEIDNFEKELSESEIVQNALKTGDKIPDVSLPNVHGNLVKLLNFGNYDWLVISFYRGQWCPYCNLELRALEKALSSLKNIPAKLIAISPQTPDNSLTTVQKNNLTFEVLSDVGNEVGKKFGLVYTIPEYLTDLYKKYGVDFQFFNGKGQIQMPMPATYVVDKNGIIRSHFVNVYAHERLDPQGVVNFLEKQKSVV